MGGGAEGSARMVADKLGSQKTDKRDKRRGRGKGKSRGVAAGGEGDRRVR